MRLTLTIAAVILSAAVAYTQTPPASSAAPANFSLTGGRFAPLTWDAMTAEQKTMIQHVLSSGRTNLGGPFNVLLRSPGMGDIAQALGAQIRFHSSLPPKLNELTIITTARYWMVQFEWNAHKRAAAQAGLSQDIIDAITAGKRPAKMAADEAAVFNFAAELLKTHEASDATLAAAKNAVGERGVVDMMCAMGYYQMVAMLLNVDHYPMPEGVAPELKPVNLATIYN